MIVNVHLNCIAAMVNVLENFAQKIMIVIEGTLA
jgi:hypothetical protein